MTGAEIYVRVQGAPKSSEKLKVQVNLEKELRSCMHCRFFYGNNSQCLAKKCIREESRQRVKEQAPEDMCVGCPYRQSEMYCFPCMKKILRGDGAT